MCGRVVTFSPSDAMAAIFGAEVAVSTDDPPDYNLAPTDPIRAVVDRGEGRQLRRFRWGLVPAGARAVNAGPLMINARAEGLSSKGVFSRLLGHRRCAVPVDGFYEWRTVDGVKTPFLATPADGGLFVMAGLWDVWRSADERGVDQVVPSLTIITTSANDTMRPVHDRMPVILPAEAWERWLDPGLVDRAEAEALLGPAAEGVISLRPVSALVNSVRNKGPEVLEAPSAPPPREVQGSLELG